MTKDAMGKPLEELAYTVNCELGANNEFKGRNTQQRKADWIYFDVIAYQKPRNPILNEIFIDSCQDRTSRIRTPMRYEFRRKLIFRDDVFGNDPCNPMI